MTYENKLVEQFAWRLDYWCKRHNVCCVDYQDAKQEFSLEVWRRKKDWDPSRGAKFTTYLFHCLQSRFKDCKKHLARQGVKETYFKQIYVSGDCLNFSHSPEFTLRIVKNQIKRKRKTYRTQQATKVVDAMLDNHWSEEGNDLAKVIMDKTNLSYRQVLCAFGELRECLFSDE